MNEPEDDISPIGDLTPLEREVAGVLAKYGVDADTDLVIRKLRSTLRVAELAKALGRPLGQRERKIVSRRFLGGQTVDQVLAHLQAGAPRSSEGAD
ncbi:MULTISPECIES: hypothetical protein [unclassified Pseudoxanthomonas]|uniref:hypothetical protein n=1 Tax=unclassified Pseudoxanthomonas TaxID=2645906 RepID=UPI00307EB03F